MKKGQKIALIVGGCLSLVLVFFLVINLVPKSKSFEGVNPFKKDEHTLISAHRGGSKLNPELTKKAFDYCIEAGYDIIEIDITKTYDDQYVICHDDTINRTGIRDDIESEEVVIAETTYEELTQYNLGVNFVDAEGNYPYRDLTYEAAEAEGLHIMRLEDFFSEYNGEDFLLFLEIKTSGSDPIEDAEYINKLLHSDDYSSWISRTMVISFSDEAIRHLNNNYPDIMVSPLGDDIIPYIATTVLGVSAFFKPTYAGIQFKYSYAGIKLARRDLISVADQRNISIAYWTINDYDQMADLVYLGADVITTDSPDVLHNIIYGN